MRLDETVIYDLLAASFTYSATDDVDKVTDYLLDLQPADIHNLGITLGLSYSRLKSMESSETFRNDMIASWLKKEDQVTEKGKPTWKTLVKALKHPRVKQEGVAKKIIEKHLSPG